MSAVSTAVGRNEPLAPEALKAPLFVSLAERMLAGGRWVVLDLGPAQAATIGFLNQFRCRLEIADLPVSIESLNAEADKAQCRQLAESVLPACSAEPVDMVLCWDLLNYLQRPALTAVMAEIAGRAQPGTLVHALIVYSGKQMPERPGPYYPVWAADDDALTSTRLANIRMTSRECEAPRYTPDDLTHCMPDYRIERAKLLSNGMQEFLFHL